MGDKNFDQQLTEQFQAALLKEIKRGSWLKIDYGAVSIPSHEIRAAYEKIDMDKVNALILQKIEERVADTIYNSLATEIATDVKKVMSNCELREDCRAVIREKIRAAAN